MRKFFILAITLIICVFIAYFFWEAQTPETEQDELEEPRAEVIAFSQDQIKTHKIGLHKAAAGDLKQVVRAPAKIILCSDAVAHVIPKTSGVALPPNSGTYKNLGDKVVSREVLARLESKEMAETKAEYLRTLKKFQLASRTFGREKTLKEGKVTSLQEYYDAEIKLDEALIDMELAAQKLYALGLNTKEIEALPGADPQMLRIYDVHSPLSGQIVDRHITPGEFIDHHQEIYTVADLSTVWAEISLFSKERGFVKEGQPLTIIAFHEDSDSKVQQAEGKVIYLSPLLNEETYRAEAIAAIDNRSGLWLPGSFAYAEIVAGKEPAALLIPKDSLHQIDGETMVFIAQPDGFALRPVELGRCDETCYEVISGIDAGDRVAAENSYVLKAELKKAEAEHMD